MSVLHLLGLPSHGFMFLCNFRCQFESFAVFYGGLQVLWMKQMRRRLFCH